MHISPVNNNHLQSKPNFRACFKRQEIINMIKEAQTINTPEGMPVLYTLLKFVKEEIPGNIAELKRGTITKVQCSNTPTDVIFLMTDNVRRHGHSEKHSLVSALMDMCVKKDKSTAHSQFVRMPERIFEDMYWANRHVTEHDILDLSYKTPINI